MAPRPKISPAQPVEIPVKQLVEDLTQPRQNFDDARQQDLNASVKQEGIHVPLEVLPIDGGRQWKIVKGARRYRAALSAKLETVPCVLAAARTLREVHRTQLLENTNRADLDPLDFGQALYIEFLSDQIAALEGELGQDGSATDQVFATAERPTERITALSARLCALAKAETVEAYLQSGNVRVPWKVVLDRVGCGRLTESQRKKLLTPVKQIAPEVQDLLAGAGASSRALADLGKLDPPAQLQAVGDAQRAAAIDDGDVGRALRGVLDAQSALGAERDEDLRGDDAGLGDLNILPVAGDAPRHDPDTAIPGFVKETGRAPKLITDRPAPERGRTPPAGHGTMDNDSFIQFTGALEAVLMVLDRSGAIALSEEQLREAGALWGELAERCVALGLGELV